MMKLALGTAQFGLNYGISNARGRIPKDEVFSILDLAKRKGISLLDTSRDYGESENVIGAYIWQAGAHFDIVSKMPIDHRLNFDETFELTLQYLQTDSLYGYLLRGYEYYENNPAIWNKIQALKSDGKIKKAGFTLYHVEELDKILQRGLNIDLVQVPYNVFDRRFESAAAHLAADGVEIHVRSVFLQGLVFQKPALLAERFNKIRDRIQRLGQIAFEQKTSIAGLCVNYVMAKGFIDRVLVGVDSLQNLQDIFGSLERGKVPEDVGMMLDGLREDDENIILPVNWNN